MTGTRAWQTSRIRSADWLLPVPPEVRAEIETAFERWERDQRPILSLTPEDFALGTTRRFMTEARRRLEESLGFVVIDRFPVETLSLRAKSGLAWLLGNMIGRVVAQKWSGTFLYDVRDSGKPLAHGVRRSITNLEQDFHTDGPWLPQPPEHIGLFCLQPASAGGESRVASLLHAIEGLSPEREEALRQPLYWDRQAEHEPGDQAYNKAPILFEDRLGTAVRWYPDYVEKGFALAGARLNETTRRAMRQVNSILAQPANHVEFRLEAGQLLYLDNRRVTHSRKAFKDDRASRHYIRIWNREEGTRHLEGRLPLDLDKLTAPTPI